MARPKITDLAGRMFGPTDRDYDAVRIDNLEREVRELTTAIVDLQNRVSRMDGEDLQWPGDTYGPTYTRPAGDS